MRTSIIAIAATFTSLVYAQSLEGLPQCAQTCVLGFTSATMIGNCQPLDAKCICSSQDFLSNIACCLSSKCDAADQASAVTYAQQICKTQGVTVPEQVVCNSSQVSSTATSMTSSSTVAASTTSSSSSATSSVSSSTSAAASPTKNAAMEHGAGAGLGFAGALAAALALL